MQSQAFDQASKPRWRRRRRWAHKYRLNPSINVRASFNAASADLVAALQQAHGGAGPEQRALIQRVVILHQNYLDSVDSMFDAVDRGDTMEVSRIAGQEVDPQFGVIVQLVEGEADREHAASMSQILAVRSCTRRCVD